MADTDRVRSYPTARFTELATAQGRDGVVVLDVRRDDERASGAIAGSVHIPLHSLIERLQQIPEGQIWVHCASGFRASIAASILDRGGFDVVHVDDEYSWAVAAGLAAGPAAVSRPHDR